MKYPWIDSYLLQKRGVTKDLKEEWNWIRYQVGGRLFAAICLDREGRPYYITLKLDPLEGDLLRQQYEDVVPGYYCDKVHWNSVRPDGAVPAELLRWMLDQSYALVLAGFPKKRQREILGLTVCGTDCRACSHWGDLCPGCNQGNGKVFHAPPGKACPIYACCVHKCRLVTCDRCPELPCAHWQTTRDPAMDDDAFRESIARRIAHLKGADPNGL